MKKRFFYLAAALLMASRIFAQTTFERYYGEPSKMDVFAASVPTPDGGFLFAGTTANYGASALDVLLLKTDAGGNTLWAKSWGGPGNDGAVAIVAAGSGGGYLVAGHVAGPDGDRNFLALRIDENGDELWHLDLGNAHDDAAVAAAALPNGEFIVVGNTIPTLAQGQLLLLVRTGSAGGMIWQKTEGIGSPNNAVKGVATTTDGGFLVATRELEVVKYNGAGIFQWNTYLLTPGGEAYALELFGRDADGTLLAGGNYGLFNRPFLALVGDDGTAQSVFELDNPANPQQYSHSFVESACRMTDGNYALWLVDWLGSNGSPEEVSFAGLDPGTGQIAWEMQSSAADLGDFRHPGQLLAKPGGGFFLAGALQSETAGRNAVVISYNSTGAETARQTYGVEAPDDNEIARKVVQTADGGYLVLADKVVDGNERDFWLLKTDANGTVQWDATYGFPDQDRIAALDATPDGGFIAAGFNGENIRALKVGATGQLLWLREFAVRLTDGTFGIVATPDNGCALIFPSYDPVTFAEKSTLMKLGASGDSLWSKFYPQNDGESQLYGATFTANGGFALCGGDFEDFYIRPMIIFTDAAGNQTGSQIYPTDDNELVILIDIHRTADNGFVTQGLFVDDIGLIRSIVIRTDANGNALWTRESDDPGASRFFSWASAHQIADGETYLFAEKRRYPPPGVPFLLARDAVGSVQKLSASGSLICESDFGEGQGTAFFQGGTATADGGAAAVGQAMFGGSSDAWLVKLNADCTVGFQAPLAPPFDLTVSPNPSPGLFFVEIETEKNGAIVVEVVNVVGEKIMQWQGEKTGPLFRRQFDLGAAPAGAYFVWVKIGATARGTTLVKP